MVIEERDIDRLPINILALLEKLILMRSHFHSSNEITDMVRTQGLRVRVYQGGPFLFWVSVDK